MKPEQIFPPLMLWSYILYTWYVVTWVILWPQWDESPVAVQRTLIAVHVLFFLVVVSIFKTYMTDPGRPPDDFQVSDAVQAERTQSGQLRFCHKCNANKPDRTHHCKKCGRCILKMDHHCNWTANCVGFRNYRYFVSVLFWATVSIGFVLVTQAWITWDVWQSPYKAMTEYLILAQYAFSLFQFANIAPLLFYHFRLISMGMTTLEYMEKYRTPDKPYNNVFNLGVANNWRQVLGSNPLLWFLPVHIGYSGDGIRFPTVQSAQRMV